MRKKFEKNQQKQLTFKKRKQAFTQRFKLLFGKFGIYSKTQTRLEGIYVKKLKLKYKKSFKRRKRQHRPQVSKGLLWIRYRPNIILTRKSKNARMGSGKGKLSRKACNIKPHQTIVEFRRIKPKILSRLQMHMKRKWNVKAYLLQL